jgi:hypothetical protein
MALVSDWLTAARQTSVQTLHWILQYFDIHPVRGPHETGQIDVPANEEAK